MVLCIHARAGYQLVGMANHYHAGLASCLTRCSSRLSLAEHECISPHYTFDVQSAARRPKGWTCVRLWEPTWDKIRDLKSNAKTEARGELTKSGYLSYISNVWDMILKLIDIKFFIVWYLDRFHIGRKLSTACQQLFLLCFAFELLPFQLRESCHNRASYNSLSLFAANLINENDEIIKVPSKSCKPSQIDSASPCILLACFV